MIWCVWRFFFCTVLSCQKNRQLQFTSKSQTVSLCFITISDLIFHTETMKVTDWCLNRWKIIRRQTIRILINSYFILLRNNKDVAYSNLMTDFHRNFIKIVTVKMPSISTILYTWKWESSKRKKFLDFSVSVGNNIIRKSAAERSFAHWSFPTFIWLSLNNPNIVPNALFTTFYR